MPGPHPKDPVSFGLGWARASIFFKTANVVLICSQSWKLYFTLSLFLQWSSTKVESYIYCGKNRESEFFLLIKKTLLIKVTSLPSISSFSMTSLWIKSIRHTIDLVLYFMSTTYTTFKQRYFVCLFLFLICMCGLA